MFRKLFSSLTKTAGERMDSSMYGSLIISWCLWNWEFLYITFFVDQDIIFELTDKLKIEYLLSQYVWTPWYSLGVWSSLKLFILPLLSAYFIVFWLSRIENWFFRETTSHQYAKKREMNQQEQIFLEETQKVLKTKVENVEIEKRIETEMSDEEKWDIEYDDAMQDNQFKVKMARLQQVLYKHSGYTSNLLEIPEGSEFLAYFDANGLVTRFKDKTNYVESTEKGRYFMKKYLKGTRPE